MARSVHIGARSVGRLTQRPQSTPRRAAVSYNANINDKERRHPLLSTCSKTRGPQCLAREVTSAVSFQAFCRRVSERLKHACDSHVHVSCNTKLCCTTESSSTIRPALLATCPWTRSCCSLGQRTHACCTESVAPAIRHASGSSRLFPLQLRLAGSSCRETRALRNTG